MNNLADDLDDEVDNYQRAALFVPDTGHSHLCGGCARRYGERPELIGKVRVLVMALCGKCKNVNLEKREPIFSPPRNMKYTKRLTPDEVKEIRRLSDKGKHRRYLAMKFDVGLTTIANVVNRLIYNE